VSPSEDEPPLPPRLVLYDGVCALCHGAVRLLVRLDRARALRYAPLQGTTAARLRGAYAELPRELDTVVLVDDGRVLLRSRALLGAARHLGWPWRALAALAWLPAWTLDPAYRLVARLRYRVFGRREVCSIPAPAARELFLP
jgi:predicted DCC family thiol-disulfide oxidoreductase YuxK